MSRDGLMSLVYKKQHVETPASFVGDSALAVARRRSIDRRRPLGNRQQHLEQHGTPTTCVPHAEQHAGCQRSWSVLAY